MKPPAGELYNVENNLEGPAAIEEGMGTMSQVDTIRMRAEAERSMGNEAHRLLKDAADELDADRTRITELSHICDTLGEEKARLVERVKELEAKVPRWRENYYGAVGGRSAMTRTPEVDTKEMRSLADCIAHIESPLSKIVYAAAAELESLRSKLTNARQWKQHLDVCKAELAESRELSEKRRQALWSAMVDHDIPIADGRLVASDAKENG